MAFATLDTLEVKVNGCKENSRPLESFNTSFHASKSMSLFNFNVELEENKFKLKNDFEILIVSQVSPHYCIPYTAKLMIMTIGFSLRIYQDPLSRLPGLVIYGISTCVFCTYCYARYTSLY